MRATERAALDFKYSPFKAGREEDSIFKPRRGFDTPTICIPQALLYYFERAHCKRHRSSQGVQDAFNDSALYFWRRLIFPLLRVNTTNLTSGNTTEGANGSVSYNNCASKND